MTQPTENTTNAAAWIIYNFDEGPHYAAAVIAAPTAEAAGDILAARLSDEDERPDTVWTPQPREKWTVAPWDGVYVLGAGCRG